MTEPSPYAPPESSLSEPVAPLDWSDLATTGQRFANLMLDSVIGVSIFAFVIVIVIEVLAPGWVEGMNETLLGVLITIVYYLFFELAFGRTLAKWITGTRVVCDDGRRPTLARVFGRTAARMIPFEAFSFLAGDGRPVGWHDSLSKTRVIRTRGVEVKRQAKPAQGEELDAWQAQRRSRKA